jgi:hypothetical protein
MGLAFGRVSRAICGPMVVSAREVREREEDIHVPEPHALRR